MEQSYLALSK
jgi:hypothetical protein